MESGWQKAPWLDVSRFSFADILRSPSPVAQEVIVNKP
jgi:hypothetical protein